VEPDRERVRETYRYWEQVVLQGRNPETVDAIDPMFLRSWQRCLAKNLNPERPIAMTLPDPQIRINLQRRQRLIEVAKPFLENLYQLVQGSGFVVVLLDEECCILALMGDKEILERDYHFRVGEFWDEGTKGTNAMGLVMIEQKPLQVYATEHYCRANHWLTCSAAPIRNNHGEMIGILDVSGDYRYAHAHTLGMVVAAVQAIQNQLDLEAANAELTKAYNNTAAIIESISDGLVSFDKYGHITKINELAVELLGLGRDDYIGQHVSTCINIPDIVTDLLNNRRVISDREVFLDTSLGRVQFLLSGCPITDNERRVSGGVITLQPMKNVQRLVTRISGARAQFTFDHILGNSRSLRRALETAKAVAQSVSTVLLEGESGTGKEMFAQAIHNTSPMHTGPFVAINCGAIPRDLLESELFGYEEGAFTGAKRGGRPGKFELANDGTLFLDEVGDMPFETQASLLRVLEEKQVIRVGGHRPILVNVRVIAATNRDLRREVDKGNFRRDLYHRLDVIRLRIPPLREREDDVLLLANHFVQKFSTMLRLPPAAIAPEAALALERYRWPGNVRELSNAIERAINLARGETVTLQHLPEPLQAHAAGTKVVDKKVTKARYQGSVQRQEEKLIKETLRETAGNVSRCASELGISRNTLYRKMKKYRISIPRE